MQQHYVVCNLPRKLGGLSVPELKILLQSEGIVRDKSNNFLKTKKDMCLALTLRTSGAFVTALKQNVDKYNPSLRDFAKLAAKNSKTNAASVDKLEKDQRRVKDLYHDLLMENYHFHEDERDPQMVGLRNQYESGRNELRELHYKLQQKENEIRAMQAELDSSHKFMRRQTDSVSDSADIAAVKIDVMHLKMQEKYLLNAIDELRLHLNRLKNEERSHDASGEVQSRILQLLDIKKNLEDSVQTTVGKLEALKTHTSPADQEDLQKLTNLTDAVGSTDALAQDADKIHKEVDEKQQDIEQLRVNLAAVRTRLQQYVDVFPRIEDAIAFATSSSDLQQKAQQLKDIIRAADGISKKINDKVDKISDLRTQQDPENVALLFQNVDVILDKFNDLSGEVETVNETLRKAESSLTDLHNTFVSLVKKVDSRVDAANLDDLALANILKDFIVNRSYLRTAISNLHHEHNLARSNTASVKSKLDNIYSSLDKLESPQNIIGGNNDDHSQVQNPDLMKILSGIEIRIENIVQKQTRDRQAYVDRVNHYKELLDQQETKLKLHVEKTLGTKIESIRSDVQDIEKEISRNNAQLQKMVEDLQSSKLNDKAKFTTLSKAAFDIMVQQSVLFHGLKVKITTIDFANTIKNFADIESEHVGLDERMLKDAEINHEEEMQSVNRLKTDLKEAMLEHTRLRKELSAVDFELKKVEIRSNHDRLLKDLENKKQDIEREISENEKELIQYHAELQAYEQNLKPHSDTGAVLQHDDVYSALENAYHTQMASKSRKLERVNEELEALSNDNSEQSLLVHQQELHHEASLKLQDIIQKLKEEIHSLQEENGEMNQLKNQKLTLLEKEKQLTEKYLGALEGRDNDLVNLADKSRLLHGQHINILQSNLNSEQVDNATVSLIELERQTKNQFEILQNECREKVQHLDQERTDLLQAIQQLTQKAEELERDKQANIKSLEQRLEDIQGKLSRKDADYDNLHSKASDILQQFQIAKKELEDLRIKTDPERVTEMENRLHDVEMQNNRSMMLKAENEHLKIQVDKLRSAQNDLQKQVFNSAELTKETGFLKAKLETHRLEIAKERVNFEKKSAEKAHVEAQLNDIRATINNLVGKSLFKFDEARPIAKETVDAVRDIAEDYNFFREAYQDTAQSLRENIVELVKTLNQGNRVIDYDSIQSRVDSLKYLSEEQQRDQIKQTRELIADDYENLVKKSKQEAKLLARSYDAENDWQQVETKINRLLAPEGTIEHSRESLKLINDFFRLTKSSVRKLQEEEQDGEIERLRFHMMAYFDLAKEISNAKSERDLLSLPSKAKQLFEVSKEISFEKLGPAVYNIDEKLSQILLSFLTVFKLRNEELFLDLIRNIPRTASHDRPSTSFRTIDEFLIDNSSAISSKQLAMLQSNTSRIELIKQLFPKVELALLKLSKNPIESVYFDPVRLGTNGAVSTNLTSPTTLTKAEVTKSLFYMFFDRLGGADSFKFLEPGNKPYDDNLFQAMLNLHKYDTVQKTLWGEQANSRPFLEKEIQRLYQTYVKPEPATMIEQLSFTNDKGATDLAKHFQAIKKFIQTLQIKQQFGGFQEDIKYHLQLKRRVLENALADNEKRLSNIEQRGGKMIDTGSIAPFDIRKLNAVLAKINDMVAANLKDLNKAKASGFENSQYETKLKKLESDLLDKENLLSQFDGITKQSVERAFLLEQDLTKQNKTFSDFCLFLMGRRKDPKTKITLFDSRKNVFAFRRDGKAIFEELDWHARLDLPRETMVFRDFTNIENIKNLLKKQASNFDFISLENVMKGLVDCHAYLQGSNRFYEEDIILQEIINLRTALDKLKSDENESQFSLTARFEDLKDLNDNWKMEMSCKQNRNVINARNIRTLLQSIGTPGLSSTHFRTHMSLYCLTR